MFQLFSMNCANNQQKQPKTIVLKFLDNFEAIMSKTQVMLYIFGKQTSQIATKSAPKWKYHQDNKIER